MAKVVVTDYNFTDLAAEQACAEQGQASFTAHQCTTATEVIDVLRDAKLAFVQLVDVPAAAVANMAAEAVIVRYGVGVDNLPLAACAKHGVRVCNVPDYGMAEVAEHACALLLALHRRLPALDAQIRGGDWDAIAVVNSVPSLSQTTLGLLGCGRIGQEVIARMSKFGVRVIAHDPGLAAEQIQAAGATSVTLEELFAQAELLSLHAPAIPSTAQIINQESIALMQDGVIIVNCARGELVNEADLAAALTSGKVAAAGLDVFSAEPLPANSPLRQAPNVLLSPHAAWCSAQSTPKLQQLAAEEGLRALRGEPLRCEVVLG